MQYVCPGCHQQRSEPTDADISDVERVDHDTFWARHHQLGHYLKGGKGRYNTGPIQYPGERLVCVHEEQANSAGYVMRWYLFVRD